MTSPDVPLSDATTSLLARQADAYDPWADLAKRTGVQLAWHVRGAHDFCPSAIGVTTFSSLTISFQVGLTDVQMRSTLAHELLHLERGPVTKGRVRDEERTVSVLAAKRLVDPVVADALLRMNPDPDGPQIAAALRVDWVTFDYYRQWRSKVENSTTHRVWEQSKSLSVAWPPTWLEAQAGEYDEAARWAGLR